MEKNITAIVGELKFATFEEIASLLSAQVGSVRRDTLESHLWSMCEKSALINVLPEENSAQLQGYVLGPGADAEESVEIKKLVLNSGASVRNLEIVNWETLSQRLFKRLGEEALNLKEDILKLRESPKKLEMRYFDLSIKYHTLHRFFYEKIGFEFTSSIVSLLNECKSCLNNIQF